MTPAANRGGAGILLAVLAAAVLATGAAPAAPAGQASCDRSALLAGVRQALDAVGAAEKPAPCLALEAGNGLVIVAAGSEVRLRYTVPGARVQARGTGSAPIAALAAVLDALGDATVTLEFTPTVCRVTAPGGAFSLTARPTSVSAPAFEAAGAFEVRAAVLRRLARRTVFAAPRDATGRPNDGVLWEVAGGQLTLVATDAKRLAVATDKTTRSAADVTGILPLSLIKALAAHLPDTSEAVAVRLGEQDVQVRAGPAEWSAALVTGRFPDWKAVVPKGTDRQAAATAAALAGALRRVMTLSGEPPAGVRLSAAEGELTLTLKVDDAGEATARAPIKLTGPAGAIAFNPRFLLEALEVLDGADACTLEFSGPRQAGLVRGPGFAYVVMPISPD